MKFHPAIEMGFQIWSYIGGTFLALTIVNKIIKLPRRFSAANQTIENAKYLPGGSKYIHPMEEEREYEELSWKTNA